MKYLVYDYKNKLFAVEDYEMDSAGGVKTLYQCTEPDPEYASTFDNSFDAANVASDIEFSMVVSEEMAKKIFEGEIDIATTD